MIPQIENQDIKKNNEERLWGAAFPFGGSVAKVLGRKSVSDSIKTSIKLILTTRKGQLPYEPERGSYLADLMYEPINDAMLNLIYYYAKKDLEDQEPRILVNAVYVERPRPHTITIYIGYVEINDPNRNQKQHPITVSREFQ